jgi:hypothetical protein
MRKALLPMIASLALCGAATGALIATNASAAGTPKKPLMVAMVTNPPLGMNTAAPMPDGPPPGALMDAPPGEMGGPMGGPPDGRMGERFRAHMAQMCKDIYAHKVGEIAFLEARLALTPAQTPAFAHWKQVNLDIAQHHSGECSTRTAKFAERMSGKAGNAAHERGTPGERLAREEEHLKTRLADIEAERPVLDALYNTLTPDQRRELGHGGDFGHEGGRFMAGMGHRGFGPMRGPGPMGPHGPADAPPPPPPQ